MQWINDPKLSLLETLEIIRDKSIALVGGRTGCCCSVDPHSGTLCHLLKCSEYDKTPCCGIETTEGIIAEAARTGNMVYIRDTVDRPSYKPAFSWVRAKITLPLVQGPRVVGILNIDSDKPRAFDPHVQLLETLAAQAAIAIENASLREQASEKLRRRLTELASFFKVSNAAVRSSTDDTLNLILDEALVLLRGDVATIRILDKTSSCLVHTHLRPTLASLQIPVMDIKFDLQKSRGGKVFTTQNPHYCNDVPNDPFDQCGKHTKALCHVLVPITCTQEAIGVLTVDASHPNAFNEDSVRLLEGLGSLAAATIHSHRVLQHTKSGEKNVVKVLALAQRVAANLRLEHVLGAVTDGTADTVSTEACSIFLLNDDGKLILRATTSGLIRNLIGNAFYRIGEGLTGIVAARQETRIVHDFSREDDWTGKYAELPQGNAKTWMASPIISKGQIRGVIRVTNKLPTPQSPTDRFDKNDASLLELISTFIGSWGLTSGPAPGSTQADAHAKG